MAKKKTNSDNAAKGFADEVYCWKIDEAFESDQETIGFFILCAYENYPKKAEKYDKVDVRALNEDMLSAFSAWDVEEDWEKNKFGLCQIADRKAPGGEKVIKLYNGYKNWLLHVEFTNLEISEKELVVSLIKKYYNHVSSDFDIKKALKEASVPDPEPPKYDLIDILINGNMTREFLEDNWDVSAYDEGEDFEIDYYLKKDDNAAGDTAYLYRHEDDTLQKLEIVHIISRKADPEAYDALLEDDDVLLKGEEEYGADCSAEFILWHDSFLVWFKEVEQ